MCLYRMSMRVSWQSVSLVAYVCACVHVTLSALHPDTECISQRLQRENAMLRRSQLELSQPASPKAHSPRSVDEERDVQNEVFDRLYLPLRVAKFYSNHLLYVIISD